MKITMKGGMGVADKMALLVLGLRARSARNQCQYQYILLFFSQYNKIFKNSRIPQLVTFQTNLKSLGYPWVPTIKFK